MIYYVCDFVEFKFLIFLKIEKECLKVFLSDFYSDVIK